MWSQPHCLVLACLQSRITPGSEGPPDWTCGHRSKSLSPLVIRRSWGTDEHYQDWQRHVHRDQHRCLHRGRRWAGHRELSTQSRSWISVRSSSAPLLKRASLKCKGTSRALRPEGNTGAAHLGVTQEPPAASRLPGTPMPWKLRRHLW